MVTILRTAPAARLPEHRLGGTRNIARRLVLMAVNALIVWQQRLDDRSILRDMTEAQLADIGLRREDALHEAGKPFWRA